MSAEIAIATAWRIRLVMAEDNPTLSAYDQDAWAWSYRCADPKDSLATLRILRRTTADLLRRMPGRTWHRAGHHQERGRMTLRDLVVAQVNHIEEHLAQIDDIALRLRP